MAERPHQNRRSAVDPPADRPRRSPRPPRHRSASRSAPVGRRCAVGGARSGSAAARAPQGRRQLGG